MSPGDALLICRDCKQSFTFSDQERVDFASHGLTYAPSRCQDCRAARKSRQKQTGAFLPAPRFRDRREHVATGTTTTCSACGNVAVVPFVLRTNQVAYCSPCFERRREAGRR
jgi:CxxC-x17-CxxC domain-containing protein